MICKCGHDSDVHGDAGCLERVDTPDNFFCPCETPKDAIDYGQIRLRRDGMFTVVSILHDGEEIDIIREVFDNNFDHVVTSDGIREEIRLYEERKGGK